MKHSRDLGTVKYPHSNDEDLSSYHKTHVKASTAVIQV